MAHQLRKISDQGTANPVVARLCVQTAKLIRFCPRGEEFQKSVLSLYHDHIQKHLLECDQITQSFVNEMLRFNDELGIDILQTQSPGKVIEVPHVLRLVPRVEHFLYCAKSVLRDLTQIFNLFFGKTFQDPRYDRIISWAEKEFGWDCELARMLREDQNLWIKDLVARRNAVEHPGGYSGHLHIHNISLVLPDHPKYPILEPPAWHLNDEPSKPLIDDLFTLVSNLLELCEDTLIICISMTGLSENVEFARIPKELRDPSCPIRIRLVPKSRKS